MLLDAHGRPVRGATATLLVNGSAAVPKGRGTQGFREVGDRYPYELKLRDQGVSRGTVTLTISVSHGTAHTFTLAVVQPPAARDKH